MSQLGRISGPLLTENLLRNGADLAFSNDRTDSNTTLLYLDVNTDRIGINTETPIRELDINGYTNSNTFIANVSADIANFEITAGKIENLSGNIFIKAADTIVVPTIRNTDIEINDNYISTYTTDTDLRLIANAIGNIVFDGSVEIDNFTLNGVPTFNVVNIDGNLSVIGNVSQAGNLSVTQSIDTGTFNLEGNYIATVETNANIDLRASGTGSVIFSSLRTDGSLTVDGSTTSLSDVSTTGTVTTSNLNVIEDLIVGRNVSLETIDITQNKIIVTTADTNLNLVPAGSGTVEILGNTNIAGNVHTSGNITMDGSFVLGDENTDNLVLNAEISSDIVPDASSTYDIGSPTKKYANTESLSFNSENITVGAITVDGNDLASRQGNVFYVAVNGDDTNVGDHQQSPFRTIKHALSASDSSVGGPVTIYVYPGEYEEEFPLTLSANTTIKGLDLRGTIIRPTVSTQSEDVFLLTGETTVEDLTIKDFYYDSLNDTGYAFRFASNAITTTRSPYIRNITVITQGSVTSAIDPRGFASGDAGKGVLVDGTDVNSASADASMLFHSCTFITPGVDALTMTGGVRVEWLNCFSYFANRGLYAFNDAIGRVNQDGSTINKGAELRSIGSASVYGNVGAEADGDEALMYLINHNFAYIGTGKDVSNDATLVIQDNETVELNSGRIYYTSQDASGNFRVGDAFVVDFDKGTTSLSDSDVALTGISSITVNTGGDETFINAEKIETGNWRIQDSTISALIGDGNIASASGTINFTNDVNMQNNLSMTGNFAMSGANFTLGNASGDNVSFEAEVNSNIIPKLNNIFTLGSDTKKWNTVWVSDIPIDELQINDNYIQTINSNASLELRANGTGDILFSSTTRIDNDITVNTANLQHTNISTLSHLGDLVRTGDKTQTGNKTITGEINVSSTAQFENVQIEANNITTTESNSDLELRANGSGEVIIPDNNLQINSDLYVGQGTTLADVVVTSSVALEELLVDDLRISDNRIETTTLNTDLTLDSDGNGKVYIPSNSLIIDSNTTVNSLTTLSTTNIAGELTHTGNYAITGNITQTGSANILGNITTSSDAQIEDILFSGNVVSTTTSNSNLDLRANGTGIVRFFDNTIISNNLQITGDLNTSNINIATSLDLNELVVNNNIEINDNYISTTVSNSNLEIRASGAGNVNLQDSLQIDNNLTVLGLPSLQDTNITGVMTRTGNSLQTGNVSVTGKYTILGAIDVGASAQFENIQINDNFITTTESNSDLELRANGTSNVKFNNNVQIDNTVFVQGNISAGNTVINTNLDLNRLVTPSNILIDDNYITTSESNSNLELRADGIGYVAFQDTLFNNGTISTAASNLNLTTANILDINTTGALILPVGTTAQGTAQQGDIRYNNEFSVFQGYATSNVTFNGVYSDDFLTRARVNDGDNVLRFDISNIEVATITDSLSTLAAQIDDVNINVNTLSTNVSNSNLEFTANGNGTVKLHDLSFNTSTVSTPDILSLNSTASGYYKISGTNGIVITTGSTANRRSNAVEGEIRYNTDLSTSEIFDGVAWISAAGVSGTGTSAAQMAELLDEYILIFG